MSRPDTPSPEAGARPVSRRGRWIRRGPWILGSGLALLLLVHLPPVKRLVGEVLARALGSAMGGEARLARLDYRLWAGEVTVEGLEIRASRLEITCVRALGDAGFGGIDVEVDSPRVVVTQGPESADEIGSPSRPWAVLRYLDTATLREGALELRNREGLPWLRLQGVEAELGGREGKPRGRARIADADVGWPAVGIRIEGVSAEAEVELERASATVRLLEGRVTSQGASLEGRGELRQIRPIVARAEGGGTIDAHLLGRLVPDLKLAGRIEARTSFEKDETGACGSVEVELADLKAFDIGPWSGSMTGSLEGEELNIDSLRLAGYEGHAEGQGSLFLGRGPASLDVHASGLDVKGLVATFVEPPPPLASRADSRLGIRMQGWDPDTLTGEGEVWLRGEEEPGWPVDGSVRVGLAEGRVSFATVDLAVRTAEVTAEGSLSFEKGLELVYGLRLPDLDGGRDLLQDAGVELPALALRGSLAIEGELGGRLPDWQGTARVSSERLSVEDVDVDVEGSLVLSSAGVGIESLVAQGADGQMTVRGFVPLAEDGLWDVEGEIGELRLTDALERHGVPVATTGRGTLRVSGPRANPTGAFEVEARAEPAGGREASRDSREPEGTEGEARSRRRAATLRLVGTASPGRVGIDELTMQLGGGVAEGAGSWVRDGGTLEGRVRLADARVDQLPWVPGANVLEDVESTLSGLAEVAGRASAPEGRLELHLARTRYLDEDLPDLDLEVELKGPEARLDGRLGGEPLLSGRVAFEEAWPLQLEMELAALPLTRMLRTLPGARREERSLDVAGQASLELPLRDPDQLTYAVRIDALDLNLGQGERGAAGPFRVQGDRDAAVIEGFDFSAGGSRLQADGELGLASDSSGALRLHGDMPLADVALFLPGAELEGDATVDLEVHGRLSQPDISGQARIDRGRGRVGPLDLEALGLEVSASGGVATVQKAQVRVAGGEVSARGQLPVGLRAEGEHTLELELRDVDLGRLLPGDGGESRLVAPLDVSGRVRATAPALDAIEAEGEITRWSVGAGKEGLSLERPAPWRFSAGELTLEDLRLRGEQEHLRVGGAWTPGGSMRLEVEGATDLALFNPLFGGELRLAGPGRLDLTARGTPDDPTLEGGVGFEAVRVVLTEPPLVVSDLTGSLDARADTLVLEARGAVGDGRLRLAGTLIPRSGGPDVDITLDAEDVPLVYPEGLRSRSSGKIRLAGQQRRYRLEGDVTVHRALYDRETDVANRSLDNVGAELRALDARGSILERVQLDVRVGLEDGLRIQNRQAQLVADGAVTVGGDLLTPDIRGSVSLRGGGTVKLSRATLRLAEGRVVLAGFPSEPPEVNLSGRTQVTGIQINVELSGPLDDLQTSLSSPNRSDLTQADLATLILTGRTAQGAADQSGAIVAEEVAAALGSALNERLGGAIFIDVSRDESLIVQDTDPTQRFNIGIPIGERLYVIHSQALDRSGVRWILDLRPQGRFRIRLISDSDQTNAVEVSHGFDFDLWSRGRRLTPETPARPRVREIRFEGVPDDAVTELQRRTKLDAGDEYDFFEGEEASRRLQKSLIEDGFRAAVVEASREAVGEGQVDVVFKVDRGPLIEVTWTGDDPGRKLRPGAGAWDAYLPPAETAARRARELQNELRARRYYQATVSAEVTTEGEGDRAVAKVVFDVRRGLRGPGLDLVFEGNDHLSDEALKAVLPPRDEAAFFALIAPSGARRLETALRTAGARSGFLFLEVGRPREDLDPQTGRLRVTIPVREGERARLVRLELPEEVENLEDAPPPELELSVGAPFRIDAYVDDRGTLARWFRNQGFPEARLAGILEPVPGGLAVRFEADTGSRPRVGDIRLGEAGPTRAGVVDRAVVLEPGDLIRPEDLARSRDRLSETRVFRSVDVRAEPTGDAGVRDVVVDVVGRPDLSLEYKVRYETGSTVESPDESSPEESRGFQFGAGVEAVNPFGWAHRYSVYGLAGKRRQLFGATFESQTFFAWRWRTQVFLFDDNEKDFETSGITKGVRGVTFQQTKRWRSGLSGRRWHDRLRLLWGYGFRRVDYTDPATGGVLAGDRAAIGASLIGDTRDSVTDPSRGLFWTASVEPNLEALGSEKTFVKLYGQVFAYVPLGETVVWAQGLRVGIVSGDDPLLLLDRRFKAGGATSVRGFGENALGPAVEGYPIGGQAMFVFNQELRFPLGLWDRLYGGVFYDAGNVWALSGDLDLRDLRHNVGAGVRVLFPFGPVRLDWAWVLDPKDGEKRSRWQFALGHAF